MNLTKRQKEILDFIRDQQQRRGITPSTAEIMEQFDFASPNAVTSHLQALKRKGAGDYAKQLAELHVGDLMKPNPLTISPTTGFSEIGEKFINTRFNYLYVTDHGRFLGAISLHDIKSYLNTPDLAKVVIAGDILRDSFPVVRAGASLTHAMECFSHHDGERLPVVSHDRELVGSISKTDVILALAGSTARPATATGSPASQ